MAVDEKYVETVENEITDEERNAFLKEMGIEAHYQAPTESNINLEGYDILKAKDLIVGDMYVGNRAEISDIYIASWQDKATGEKKEETRIDFVLFDDDEKEAYLYPIKVKSTENLQTKVYGKLNLLAVGLMELRQPGISKALNRIDTVNIKTLQKYISQYETIAIECFLNHFKDDTGNMREYNDIKIVSGTLKE